MEIVEAAFAFRRRLEGETTIADATKSSWNPALAVHTCERCNCKLKSALEVHHIRPRKDANSDGSFSDGSHQDDLKNLIVLCTACHDAHHRGEFEIGPLQMTDKGETRVYTPTATPPPSPPQQQDTTKQLVVRYLREYPNMSPKLLSGFIQSREGILITKEKISAIKRQTKNEN